MPSCHSVILYWHWANQSLPYPNNAESQATKWQVSILKSLVWLNQGSNPRRLGFEPARFRLPNLPAPEVGALLIRPTHLVHNHHVTMNVRYNVSVTTLKWCYQSRKPRTTNSSSSNPLEPTWICLFVVVLCHSDSISVTAWQWNDGWDEKEKAWAQGILDLRHHAIMV